jgi:hypothetical protein
MTKKDYIAIAAIIATARKSTADANARDATVVESRRLGNTPGGTAEMEMLHYTAKQRSR